MDGGYAHIKYVWAPQKVGVDIICKIQATPLDSGPADCMYYCHKTKHTRIERERCLIFNRSSKSCPWTLPG